jgi:acyl carrier protein
MENIKTTIRKYIVENFLFGDSSVSFTDQESFMEKGILDSTGILDMILFIEKTYNIKIEDDEITPDNLDSLVHMEKFIQKKSGAAKHAAA